MSVATGALPQGTRVGRYEIRRLLGSGGMAEVYEALHTQLNKRVAIKVLHRVLAQNHEIVQRFVREGETAAKIRHPHVIDITDVGVEKGLPYLVMEYLDGEALSALIRREGRLSIRAICDILLPVIAAVDTAHAVGVIHRDLKPDNILLTTGPTGDIHPNVLDFGIARVVGDQAAPRLTSTSSLLGTPHYLSPEQATGAKNLDERSDQYAIGVILYEAITGATPCKKEQSLLEVLYTIVQGRFPTPRSIVSDLPVEFENVILRAMARNPNDRFPSLKALGHQIVPYATPKVASQWARVFGRPTGPILTSSALVANPLRPQPNIVEHATGETTRPDVPSAVASGYSMNTPTDPSYMSGSRPMPLPAPPPSHQGQTPLPSELGSYHPPFPGQPQHVPIGANYSSGYIPVAAGPAPTQQTQRSRGGLIAAVTMVALVAAATTVVLVLRNEPADPAPAPAPGPERAAATPTATTETTPPPAAAPVADPTSPSAAAVETYAVKVVTKPATATIEIDGVTVGTGSVDRSFPIDGTEHTLRVSNEGYEPKTAMFRDAPPPETVELVAMASPATEAAPPSRRTDDDRRRRRRAHRRKDPAAQPAGDNTRPKIETDVVDPWDD